MTNSDKMNCIKNYGYMLTKKKSMGVYEMPHKLLIFGILDKNNLKRQFKPFVNVFFYKKLSK